jgi:FMN-dependent oxidoreductase (nitrilotriacetate monooxygenase family)
MDQLPPKAERYETAQEFVEVVLKLWDCWEPSALVKGPDGKIAVDGSRIRPVNYVGNHFKVRGPSQSPRSRQGRPVLFQAGASEEGYSFAARIADGVFCVALDLASAKEFYADMKARIKAASRNPDKVHILPGVYMYLGSTDEEVRRELDAQSTTPDALKALAFRLSTNVENLSLDETVPLEVLDEAAANPRSHGHALSMINVFRKERLTIREFLVRQPARGPHRVLAGTPEQVVASLEQWFTERAADGFNVGNLSHHGLDLFVDHVVPILQKRGLYRREYAGDTFRSNFLGN